MLCPQQPRPRSRPALPAPGGQERRGRCRGQSRRGLGTLAPQGLQAVGPGLPSEQWAVTGREPPGRLKGARSPWSDWRSAPGAWERARAADPREGGASPGRPGRRHPPRPGRDRAALPRPTGPTWVLLSVRELNLHIVVPRNLLDPGTFGTHDGAMEFLGYGALHGHLGFLGQARHAGETEAKVNGSWSVHVHATTKLADATFSPQGTQSPTCNGAEDRHGAGPKGGLAGVSPRRLQSVEGSSVQNRTGARSCPELEPGDADFSAEEHPPFTKLAGWVGGHISPRGGTLGGCGSDSTRSHRASLEKAPPRQRHG